MRLSTPIRFTELDVWQADYDLRLAFSHNLASRKRVSTLFVRVRTERGNEGYGQALPRDYLSGESMESVVCAIREKWWPALGTLSISEADSDAVLSVFTPMHADADEKRLTASYSTVELAALDAFAHETGKSISTLLGSKETVERLPLVGVVPAAGPRLASRLSRILKWLGYQRFKVKVGRDEAADKRRIEAVRNTVGQDAWLAVDANAAWSPDEAKERLIGLSAYGIQLAEEPIRRENAKDIDYLQLEEACGISIMADESLCTIDDAKTLLKRGSPSWWNLRFGKNGGFVGMRELAALARANAIKLYGGVLVGETSLLAAAGRAAMFDCGVECMEYGFPRLFIKGDPFRGGPGGFSGWMSPPLMRGVGSGIRLRKRIFEKQAHLLWSSKG